VTVGLIASSPNDFAAAVSAHRFDDFAFEREAIALARETLAETGLLVVGEPHGVRETPSVLYRLASLLGMRAVGFEWSHEEMDEPVQEFLRTGKFDFGNLWSLSPSAEFFCGDGRITAGHFALLQRLRAEGRLDQVIAFDRLDPEPLPDDSQVREQEMADRLLAERDEHLPLIVLTGASHAQLNAPEGETMAAHLARDLPGLLPAMLDYVAGRCWSRGQVHDVSGPIPDVPIRLRIPEASPAVVPGCAGS